MMKKEEEVPGGTLGHMKLANQSAAVGVPGGWAAQISLIDVNPASSWTVVGTLLDDDDAHGMWIKPNIIHERRLEKSGGLDSYFHRHHPLSAAALLIPWGCISFVILGDQKVLEEPRMGFTTSAK